MQEFVDPLVLQPASLDVATVKKKPEDDVALSNSHSISNNLDGIDLWIQVTSIPNQLIKKSDHSHEFNQIDR